MEPENVSQGSNESPKVTYKTDRFHELYIQALKHKLNQQKIMQLNLDTECTFKPKIYTRGHKQGFKSASKREMNVSDENGDLRATNEQNPQRARSAKRSIGDGPL